MPPPPPRPKALRPVFAVCDAFRVLFCAGVILTHAAQAHSATAPPSAFAAALAGPWGSATISAAPTGVWGLFVLSGFFFALKARTPRPLLRRIRDRLLRLYPAFAASTVLMLVVNRCLVLGAWRPRALLHALTLSPNLRTNPRTWHDMPNTVAWTVCVDFQLHLLGLLLCAAGRAPRRHLHFAGLGAAALALRRAVFNTSFSFLALGPGAFHFWSMFSVEWRPFFEGLPGFQGPYEHDPEVYQKTATWIHANWICTAASLTPFVMGWWLGWLVGQEQTGRQAPSLPRLLSWPARLAVPLLYLVPLFTRVNEPSEEVLRAEPGVMVAMPPVMSVLLAVLLYQTFWAGDGVHRLLRCGGLTYHLSRLSYCVYLLQWPAFLMGMYVFPAVSLEAVSLRNMTLFAAFSYAAALPLAVVTHHAIERPFLRVYGGGR